MTDTKKNADDIASSSQAIIYSSQEFLTEIEKQLQELKFSSDSSENGKTIIIRP